MKIKDILRNDKLLSNYFIEVNGEMYDEYKHGDLIHIDTDVETEKEYSNILGITFYYPILKFIAIEQEKVLKFLENEDVDNSLSDYMDKRIKEVSEE